MNREGLLLWYGAPKQSPDPTKGSMPTTSGVLKDESPKSPTSAQSQIPSLNSTLNGNKMVNVYDEMLENEINYLHYNEEEKRNTDSTRYPILYNKVCLNNAYSVLDYGFLQRVTFPAKPEYNKGLYATLVTMLEVDKMQYTLNTSIDERPIGKACGIIATYNKNKTKEDKLPTKIFLYYVQEGLEKMKSIVKLLQEKEIIRTCFVRHAFISNNCLAMETLDGTSLELRDLNDKDCLHACLQLANILEILESNTEYSFCDIDLSSVVFSCSTKNAFNLKLLDLACLSHLNDPADPTYRYPIGDSEKNNAWVLCVFLFQSMTGKNMYYYDFVTQIRSQIASINNPLLKNEDKQRFIRKLQDIKTNTLPTKLNSMPRLLQLLVRSRSVRDSKSILLRMLHNVKKGRPTYDF